MVLWDVGMSIKKRTFEKHRGKVNHFDALLSDLINQLNLKPDNRDMKG